MLVRGPAGHSLVGSACGDLAGPVPVEVSHGTPAHVSRDLRLDRGAGPPRRAVPGTSLGRVMPQLRDPATLELMRVAR